MATQWISARPGFLFPVRALAKVFRGRYLAGLRRAFDRGALHLTGGLALLAEPAAFAAWLEELRAQAWVVYCKPPFAGPEHVLAYLGRYTHRVALSNDRLVAVTDGRVRFRWRDYADGDRVKLMELDVDEFLRRFLLHVVPDGFVRIRHFGLLANRRRAAALAQCRVLLAHRRRRLRAAGVRPRPPAPRHRHRHRTLPDLSAGRAAARSRSCSRARSPGIPRESRRTPQLAPAARSAQRPRPACALVAIDPGPSRATPGAAAPHR